MDAIDISASGLAAQRMRMNVIATNLANANNTFSEKVTEMGKDGKEYTKFIPYRRKTVIFEAMLSEKDGNGFGVSVPKIVEDTADFKPVYDPNHPHAVKNPNDPNFGNVLYPNIDSVFEMVNMIDASRAYEANITAIDAVKGMQMASLRILA